MKRIGFLAFLLLANCSDPQGPSTSPLSSPKGPVKKVVQIREMVLQDAIAEELVRVKVSNSFNLELMRFQIDKLDLESRLNITIRPGWLLSPILPQKRDPKKPLTEEDTAKWITWRPRKVDLTIGKSRTIDVPAATIEPIVREMKRVRDKRNYEISRLREASKLAQFIEQLNAKELADNKLTSRMNYAIWIASKNPSFVEICGDAWNKGATYKSASPRAKGDKATSQENILEMMKKLQLSARCPSMLSLTEGIDLFKQATEIRVALRIEKDAESILSYWLEKYQKGDLSMDTMRRIGFFLPHPLAMSAILGTLNMPHDKKTGPARLEASRQLTLYSKWIIKKKNNSSMAALHESIKRLINREPYAPIKNSLSSLDRRFKQTLKPQSE